MAKFTVLAAALLALIAVAQVSAFRTTITTTVVDDDQNPRGSSQEQRCQQQMQEQQQLSHCKMYLSQQKSFESLAMSTNQNQLQRPPHLSDCCQQLRRMDEECRCDNIKMAVMQQQRAQQWRGERMQQVMRKAEDLPNKCDLDPQCRFQAVWF